MKVILQDSGRTLDGSYVTPGSKSSPDIRSRKQVTPASAVMVDGCVGRQKALGFTWVFEAAHRLYRAYRAW